jgi:integrase
VMARNPSRVSVRRVPKDPKKPIKHWIVQWHDDEIDSDHPYGHRHQVQRNTEHEALALRARTEEELREGVHTSPTHDGTIRDAAVRYLESCAAEGIAPETLTNYRNKIEMHITGPLPNRPQTKRSMPYRKTPVIFRFNEKFGGLRFPEVDCRDLTVPMANQFRDHLLRTCSYSMAYEVWFFLNMIFKNQVDKGELKQNVIAQAKKIKRPGREELIPGKNMWAVPQIRRRIAALEEEGGLGLLAITATLAVTGMRIGEALGLPLHAFDREAGKFRISQVRTKSRRIKDTPKTAAGRREVLLPRWAVEIVARYIDEERVRENGTQHLFRTDGPEKAEEVARYLTHYGDRISDQHIHRLTGASRDRTIAPMRKYLDIPTFKGLGREIPELPPDAPLPKLPYHRAKELWGISPEKAQMLARYYAVFEWLPVVQLARHVGCRGRAATAIRDALGRRPDPRKVLWSKIAKLPPRDPNDRPLLHVPEESEDALLFTNRFGGGKDYDVVRNELIAAQIRAGIINEKTGDARYTGLHRFRHYFATEMLDANIPIKRLQKWLGHKHAAYTMDIYGHFIPDEEGDRQRVEEAALKLYGGLGKTGPRLVAGTALQAKEGELQVAPGKLLKVKDSGRP